MGALNLPVCGLFYNLRQHLQNETSCGYCYLFSSATEESKASYIGR